MLGDFKLPGDSKGYHHLVFLFLITCFVIFLPLSKYMTSLLQILLFMHWILRGEWGLKWQRLIRNKGLWVFLIAFLSHLAGMVYSTDTVYGWHDLLIKLPLLILPIIFATSESLNKGEVKWVLLLFVAAVLIGTFVSLAAMQGWINQPITDFRDASLFISHIRFALLINTAVFILSYYAVQPGTIRWQQLTFFGTALYLLSYLVVTKSVTGLVIGLIVGIFLAVRWVIFQPKRILKILTIVLLIVMPVFVAWYIGSEVFDFYDIKDSREELDLKTESGNLYWHDHGNLQLENGHYIGLYLCEPELEAAWNKQSKYNYWGRDDKDQMIRYTLRRYMTSLGLRKDSAGVSKLRPDDIRMIEAGFANHIYKEKQKFRTRIYELIWEIDVYKKGGNPSGHSVTQRIEYFKTGWSIFQDHPIFGVGTGDIALAYQQKYQESETQLDPRWQLRAHNQWLTFAVALGVVGFVLIFIGIFLPGFMHHKFRNYLFLLVFLISMISMFNEDTLETQAGVAFFAFFYSFTLFT